MMRFENIFAHRSFPVLNILSFIVAFETPLTSKFTPGFAQVFDDIKIPFKSISFWPFIIF
ncbi:TPA: hypothetical protein DEP21_01795 [Patescibacteria group bacterium]|nr:hypothetical protein [Candidatus Gracilibacteria bacterium]